MEEAPGMEGKVKREEGEGRMEEGRVNERDGEEAGEEVDGGGVGG